MSKGYRNGAFALGLVTGAGIALNLFLWLDYKAEHKSDASPQTNSNTNGNEVGSHWDGLIGTFVSPSDTLAQWIMASFTVVIVILVWKTLIATQNMASETTRIGEAQARAYVHVKNVEIQDAGKAIPEIIPDVDRVYKMFLTVENAGSTPAKWYEVSGTASLHDLEGEKQCETVTVKGNRWGVLSSRTEVTCPFYNHSMPQLFERARSDEDWFVSIEGTVRYKTEFDEVRTAHFAFFVKSSHLINYARTPIKKRKPIKMTRPVQKTD